MPKPAPYALCWQETERVYALFESVHLLLPSLSYESDTYFNALSTLKSFSFHSRRGTTFTARKETRQRGDVYWYAYRRNHGKLMKRYLGRTSDLTFKVLEQAAEALASEYLPADTVEVQSISDHVQLTTTADSEGAAALSGQDDVLLATKLRIPPIPRHHVWRARLSEALQHANVNPLTLVIAPAGFGKTTAVSAWLQHLALSAAWVSLESDDDTPGRFWSYVLSALNGLDPGLVTTECLLLQSPQPPPIRCLLTGVINTISARAKPLLLVLDDYHVITSPTIHEQMTFLLDHMPPQLHIILITRTATPLALGRYYTHGQLVQLRTGELRFTDEETRRFFASLDYSDLPSDAITMLESHADGWIAGLQLMALSARELVIEEAVGFITRDKQRYFEAYLLQDVLAHQPEPVRDFLLQTALLSRLNASLCEAVTGVENGQVMLDYLEWSNLFLNPLDDERHWYRYHQLFADALSAMVRRRSPEMIRLVHQRAARWFELQDLIDDAIKHLLAAGEQDDAARLVERRGQVLVRRGDFAQLLRWLAFFPEKVLAEYLPLALLHAEVATFIGLPAVAEQRINAIEEMLSPTTAGIESRFEMPLGLTIADVRDELLVLRLTVSAYLGRANVVLEQAQQLQARLSSEQHFLRGLTTISLGLACLTLKRWKQAYMALDEAVYCGVEAGRHVHLTALTNQAYLCALQGQLHRAAEHYQQALQHGDERSPAACMAYLGYADLLREWDVLDSAAIQLQKGIVLGKSWGFTGMLIMLFLVLAQVRYAQGDEQGVFQILAEGETLSSQQHQPFYARLLEAGRIRFCLLCGDRAPVTAWLQRMQSHYTLPVDSLHIIEDLTLARVLLAYDEVERAVILLHRLKSIVEATGESRALVGILVLLALAYQQQGLLSLACQELLKAFTLAEPEGYIRIFLDERQPMIRLLTLLQQHVQHATTDPLAPELRYYIDAIIARINAIDCVVLRRSSVAGDMLSLREMDVLSLLAVGCSNQEIARRLTIALSTVKSHLHTIYGKLQVENRTQAVGRARQLRLLTE